MIQPIDFLGSILFLSSSVSAFVIIFSLFLSVFLNLFKSYFILMFQRNIHILVAFDRILLNSSLLKYDYDLNHFFQNISLIMISLEENNPQEMLKYLVQCFVRKVKNILSLSETK